MMMMAPRQAPVNPLGGMDPRPLSARSGGPMNALSRGAPAGMGSMLGGPRPAGGRSANDPMRIAEQARRRGDPSLIMGLAQQQQGQQFQREMFGAQQNAMNERDQVNFGQGLQMFGAQQAAMNERYAMNFQQQQRMFQQETARRAGESDLDWQRRREAEAADRAAGSVVGAEPMQMPGGGFVPMVTRADGRRDMAGGFVPGPKPEIPLTADDIAAARAMGGDVRMQMGDATVSFPGMTAPKPTRLTPLPGAPSMVQGGAPTPDRVFDPYTGEFYEAGKVPGRGTAAAPAKTDTAKPADDTKARMNALRKRLGLPEL